MLLNLHPKIPFSSDIQPLLLVVFLAAKYLFILREYLEWNGTWFHLALVYYRVKIQRAGSNNTETLKGRYIEHLIFLVNKNKNLADELES